jgi:hypothetical protein
MGVSESISMRCSLAGVLFAVVWVLLTTATLPVAEIAPTARLDCRRAFLNILTEVYVSRMI